MNRIRELREERRLSQERLAELAATTRQQIDRLEKGQRGLDLKWMVRIARALDVPVAALVDSQAGPTLATLVGAVGAGERIVPFDRDATFENIPAPPGLTAPAAVVVRGDSMEPVYRNGEVLLYDRADSVPAHSIGRDCAVQLAPPGPGDSGDMLLKVVQRGTRKDRYNLLSYNPRHPPIVDARLLWAAPIQWVKRG
jgi:phage repressor protein C with HTH and peptisase S24 domain